MKNYGGDDTADKSAEPVNPVPGVSVESVFEFETRCSDGCGIYGSIERTGKCGDDEATDEMFVSVGHCEKREKFVHNACLLNYYYYLCDSFDEKLACATARCIAGRSAKASP